MNRFFLTPDHIHASQITFPPEIAHQIRHVLRLWEGDCVEVLDNTGMVYQVQLLPMTYGNEVVGSILGSQAETAEPGIALHLLFALTSREKVEWILQKGTEIGVSAFQPFVSSRSLVQSTALPSKKAARWERIIIEAAEQSRRGRLPVLNSPLLLSECISASIKSPGISLVAWESADQDASLISEVLKDQHPESVRLLVGPEGGFSGAEISAAERGGWQVVSLGRRILRMETAAIVLPALVMQALGEI